MGIGNIGKKLRITKADLKTPLPPGLRPATQIELLRARQAKIYELMHRPIKKPSQAIMGALASRAKIGVSYPENRVSDVMRIAQSNSPYRGVAKALVNIWKMQRAARLDVLVEDRRILNSLTNRLRATTRPKFKGKLILTKKEKKVLRDYLKNKTNSKQLDYELTD